ncbi:5-formyltetrahydrofolate cyclo-ligase [Mucilaginibacter agri]|uniref:5-formyltetrahydrofolate cyclo-ligase n=1 Tax=Mucilaginibacter agri TaxID=2695265 RepID=A0A965ZE94_9SPHI|nr:5-formyltetrahydrofolate cyclo-ligase [Mucilaginibacter agri]NCD69454.1 5-formyltetrahydrofolate cyclo-ligase [Mucilaginibacter agri]
MTKQELRKQFIEKRTQLSQVEYVGMSQKLLQQFQQLDLTAIKCIHAFLPIHKRREPDTTLIINWLKNNHPEIKIVYPKTNFAHCTMQSFIDDADLVLENSGFNIPEPVSGNQVESEEIDMILVPLLAFDKQGYRVGYGKGFYDRFITLCRQDVKLIGLSFFEPVDTIDDIDKYDKALQVCITPNKVYKF